jgi:hypothetical protein
MNLVAERELRRIFGAGRRGPRLDVVDAFGATFALTVSEDGNHHVGPQLQVVLEYLMTALCG